MVSSILLVLGMGVLSVALRTFRHPFLFRLGTLGIIATSFLAGWLVGGNVWLGVLLGLSWLLLPWLEILTRIRRLRLPIERTIGSRPPPGRNSFPGFDEITAEVEEQGFEHIDDVGWDHEENRHFYRVFHHPGRKAQASICLAEQEGLAFYYLSVTSRTDDDRVFVTWNYPFSYGLKLPPRFHVHRFQDSIHFADLLAAHQRLLESNALTLADLAPPAPEALAREMQAEMRDQIRHNLDLGLLQREGRDLIRYTPRGLFYLWFQFLRDFVRFS